MRGDAKALTAACQEIVSAGAHLQDGLASRMLSAWTLGQGCPGYGASGQLGSHAKVCFLWYSTNDLMTCLRPHKKMNALPASAGSSSRPCACCLSDCTQSGQRRQSALTALAMAVRRFAEQARNCKLGHEGRCVEPTVLLLWGPC